MQSVGCCSRTGENVETSGSSSSRNGKSVTHRSTTPLASRQGKCGFWPYLAPDMRLTCAHLSGSTWRMDDRRSSIISKNYNELQPIGSTIVYLLQSVKEVLYVLLSQG